MERVGLSSVGRAYVLQFLLGGGVIAQANPALGGVEMETVWRLKRFHAV